MSQFSKYLYLGLLLLGLYQAFVIRDYVQSGASFGIALALTLSIKQLLGKQDRFGKKLY